MKMTGFADIHLKIPLILAFSIFMGIFSSPVQSTGRAIVLTWASAFALALALALVLALALPFPSRHF